MTGLAAAPLAAAERTGGGAAPRVFADFHCHTRFSRDSRLSEDDFIRRAVARGLTHVAVTDHNTIDGSLAVRRRAAALGLADALRVILGEEVSSADGEIVALFITATIPRDLSAEDTADAIHAQGGLVSVPHPFDPFRRSHIQPDALERLALSGRIDMLEVFNSRVTLARHNDAAADVAARYRIPAIAASDSHTGMEVAMSTNALDPFTTAAELRAALPTNQWTGSRTTKLAHLGTRWAVARNWAGARLGRDR